MTPKTDVHIDEDSWHVSGLRGTGSMDYTMEDVFVPDERAFSFFVSPTFHPGPLSLLPRTMFALSVSAVTIGIARAALQALKEIASTKKTAGVLLRERADVQLAAAQAEGLLGAARAYVREMSGEVWRACVGGTGPSLTERLQLRAASVISPQLCAQAVDLAWKAGGAASIRESYVLERCFRDVHAATQHLGVGEPVLLDTGRGLLGLDPEIVPF